MHRFSRLLSIFILASLLTACAGVATAQTNDVSSTGSPLKAETTVASEVSQDPPQDCPLTTPPNPPFIPPSPYDTLNSFKDYFWFGSSSLWTVLPQNGVWNGLPFSPSAGYTQKVLWWRDGYVWTDEPEPNLIVSGERLDASATPLRASKATNAYASDIGSAMMVGVEIPTMGCWKITGQYNGTELSFVIWVAPQ